MSIDLTSAAWYLARGSGVSALVLFTVVVVLGIATRASRPLAGAPRFAVRAVHASAALIATVFLALHVITLLFDPYAQLRLVDLVLPFSGAYRPIWLGLGTLALDLVIAIGISSWLRERMGARAWKAVHWTAYAAWPLAVLHGLGTGTDAGTWWLRTITAGCVAAVLVALAWRGSTGFEASRGRIPAVRGSASATRTLQGTPR